MLQIKGTMNARIGALAPYPTSKRKSSTFWFVAGLSTTIPNYNVQCVLTCVAAPQTIVAESSFGSQLIDGMSVTKLFSFEYCAKLFTVDDRCLVPDLIVVEHAIVFWIDSYIKESKLRKLIAENNGRVTVIFNTDWCGAKTYAVEIS